MVRKIIELGRPAFKADEGDEAGTFTGYGSTWDNVDSMNERVIKGAFADGLEDFVRDGFIPIGHDWMGLPVATVRDAVEDDTGLLFTAEFHTDEDSQKARRYIKERVERGKSVKLSIGYEVLEDRKAKDGVRELTKLKLFEVSIVTVPANPLASVTDAKSYLSAFGSGGMKLEDHSLAVRSAVEEYTRRLKEHREWVLDKKEGRTLSEANRKRMAEWGQALRQMAKDIDALLAATAPKDEGKINDHFRASALAVRLLGVQ